MKGDNADKIIWAVGCAHVLCVYVSGAWRKTGICVGLGMCGRDIMLIQGEKDPESVRNSELKSYKYFGYKDQEFISLCFLHLLKCNISITFDIYYCRLCGSPQHLETKKTSPCPQEYMI